MLVHAGIFKQMSLDRRFLKEAETAASLDPNHVDARMGLIEFYLLAPGILGGGKDKAQKTAAGIALLDPSQGYIAQSATVGGEQRHQRGRGRLS
jgi:hypothetical protein